MKKTLSLLVISMLVAPAYSEAGLVPGVDYSGRLLVKPKAGANLSGMEVRARLDKLGIVAIQVPSKMDPLQFGRQLMATGNFEYAHPDYICHPIEIPNDPQVLQQWHLFQVSAPRAWDATAGSASVVIAVTDTGVDLTHPDLQNRVPGYNAVSNLTQADGGDLSDIHATGHGTRVTGLACATGNNGIGIAGVAYESPFMPIRISNQSNGTALMSDILEGITWAVDHGAKVINTSYDHVEVPAVQTTGEYAWNNGAVSVWGAGNGNVDTKTLPDPDLDWDHKRVIVVGSTDQNDAKASFSNYGKGVDIFAPGTQLLTTNKGGVYGTVTGTSYSAPLVAGALALVLANENPTNPSLERLVESLLRSSRDLGVQLPPGQVGYMPGNDAYWGWGRLNAGASLFGWVRTLRYKLTELPPLAGHDLYSATSINDHGVAVGQSQQPGGGRYLATMWPTTGIPEQIGTWPPGTVGYEVAAINNHGDCAITATTTTNQDWVYRFSSGIMTPMPNTLGTSPSRSFDINEEGIIIGYAGGQAFVWPSSTPVLLGLTSGYSRHIGTALNNFGMHCVSAGPDAYGWYHAFKYDGFVATLLPDYGYSSVSKMSDSMIAAGYSTYNSTPYAVYWDLDYPAYSRFYQAEFQMASSSSALDVNEFSEVVGHGEGRAFIFDGFRVGRLDEFLSEPLPSGWSHLQEASAVNNQHQIVGIARKFSGKLTAFRADPVEGITVTVDLGQLGSNPIYLGALPPACVVDFRDEAGNYIPNSRREYAYNSGTGHIQVAIPPEVTGSYRMYFRLTNVNDNPDYASGGWQGPGYLGKVYPPLNEPALPIDAIYVPDMTLYVGDCDSDNEISISDYARLSAAYGSFDGDTNWDTRADLDGDLEISIGDYAILSLNYGLVGD